MSVDMKLARDNRPGWINLAIGEPAFLQKALAHLYPESVILDSFQYPYPASRGSNTLRNRLAYAAHNPFGSGHYVITNGAKQALAAAIYAAKKVRKAKSAFATAPYWLSFPSIAKSGGMSWGWKGKPQDNLMLSTFPNNPDGFHELPAAPRGCTVLWDAVYATPTYGLDRTTKLPAIIAPLAVGSASKAYGLSGIRLGWVFTHDIDLADAAAEFVETTTSGVSTAAQTYFEAFLCRIAAYPDQFDAAVHHARCRLTTAGDRFMDLLGKHMRDVRGVPAQEGGMFAWFKPKDADRFETALEIAHVLAVGGEPFGMKEPGWFRMNLGADSDILLKALTDLARNLKK